MRRARLLLKRPQRSSIKKKNRRQGPYSFESASSRSSRDGWASASRAYAGKRLHQHARYRAATILLDKNAPNAIFAGSDMIGIEVLRAAAECNVCVPRGLSVTGFDDIQMSRYMYPR